jgi:hypothetical protein
LSRGFLKIGVKYCGGCNPSFDRIAAAEKIKERFKEEAEFVSYSDPDAEFIIVLMGCGSACADLSGIDEQRVFIVSSEADADEFSF